MTDRPYDVVTAPPTFTVLTVIPYSEEPEYREYTTDSEELPQLLASLRDGEHAEQIVTVEPGDSILNG